MAPGLFWLWFFVRKNSYRPEPRRLVVITFVLGMVSTFPAAIIETFFMNESMDAPEMSLGVIAVNMFFVVGPVEEFSKFMAVRLYAFRSRYFEEPMDGLVYAAAASLGFASMENFFYIVTYGPEVIVGRATLSTLGHLVFGSFWGYALGRAGRRTQVFQGRSPSTMPQPDPGPERGNDGAASPVPTMGDGQPRARRQRLFWVLSGLGLAAVLHGLFNIAVVGRSPGVVAGLVVLGAFWTMAQFNWARSVSPFRYRRNYPLVLCSACGQPVRVTLKACRRCGTALGRGDSAIICGHCSAENRPDAAYCIQCGDRFEK